MLVFKTKLDIANRKPYIVTTYRTIMSMGRIFSKGMIEQREFHYKDDMDNYINTLLHTGYTKIY